MSAPPATTVDRPRGPIAWMAGNSVAANLVMFACLVGGALMLRNIKQEVFPDLAEDVVTVTVPYPGASPEEVERGILLAIEEGVRGLDGVKEVTSVAREGMGTVSVEMLLGGDLQKLANDVKNEVDRIITFPEEAEEPIVSIRTRRREAIQLALYGDTSEAALHELAEQIRDQLLQDPNITQLDLLGVRRLEISIEVPQENLRRYGLTLEEVAARVRQASLELPGGGVKTRGGEILVRVKERRDYGRQFAELPIITAPDGTTVRLGEIAEVIDGYEDSDYHATYNGKPAVILSVYRVGEQTPMQVASATLARLERMRPSLPPGIHTAVLRNMADVYRQRVELLVRNGTMGLCLVMVLLGLFLEVRLAFWVMLGIPISFLGSMLILPGTGVSLNMVSLFAYIIALGIVVDDAIVVGENVYHYHQQGMPFLKAAVRGAREVAMPVTFSILTNIATFLPLYFIPGVMGRVFRMIPVVVISVFLISLLESLFVLPSHLGHARERTAGGAQSRWLHARQQAFSRAFLSWVRRRYGPFLDFTLRHRYVTIAAAVSTLALAAGYAASGRMGFGFFPRVESDWARVEVYLPYGTAIEKTEAAADQLRRAARAVVAETGREELVKGIFTEIGREGSHHLAMMVFLADPEIREQILSTEQFVRAWRRKTGAILGAKLVRFESDFGGPGRGPALEIELSHRSIATLERASTDLSRELKDYPRVTDIFEGYQPGKQQLDFTVKPEGKALGLTALGVARQVRSAFYGAEALRQQRGRNEIKVMVRLPKAQRISEFDIDELVLRTPGGREVMLREVVEVRRGRAYTEIRRREGRRVISVTADVIPRDRAGEVVDTLRREFLPRLARRYPGLSYSFEGKRAEQNESMASLQTLFMLAMLAVYALLAIPFRSYLQPLIVMVSIPFGIVGAVLGHLLMGYSLSVISMLGIVALSGVVVNDSLVLIDFTNRRRRLDGLTPHDAVCDAGIQRFRPILLTTLTTFGGLAPMIFETSLQARFLIPMAISLGFGILFATGITLVLVPSLYLAVEDVRGAAGWLWGLLRPGRAAGRARSGGPAAEEVLTEPAE